jgi:moderate conductance mechanosensitive channel
MIRIFFLIGLGLSLALRPSIAADPPTAPDAKQVLEILKDERRRAELIATLEVITAARPASAPAEPGAGLAPDGPSGRLVLGASTLLYDIGRQAQDTFLAVGDLPRLARWLLDAAADPVLRSWLLGALWRLLVVMGIGWAGAWLARRLLNGPRAHRRWRITRPSMR